MRNFLYQILHPWHWLTYGQNATGLGIVGLFLYTIYTRRMMKLAELSRRATITPIFSLRNHRFAATNSVPCPDDDAGSKPSPANEFRLYLTITNVGEGPAIGVSSWYQPVSQNFNIDRNLILIKDKVPDGETERPELLRGESMNVSFFPLTNLNHPWLFVIQSTDQAKGKHQLQVLLSGEPQNEMTVQMVHGLGESIGERVVSAADRFVEIMIAVRRAFKRL
jgi:hypothetical protein